MIVRDIEGFPFEYKPSACNYRSIPEEAIVSPATQPIGLFIAQSLLEKRSEAKMSAEYRLRTMLSKYADAYITDDAGKVHQQVKFTKNYAVFRYRNPTNAGGCIKYRFPYSTAGIEHCRKLLASENTPPTINAEYI